MNAPYLPFNRRNDEKSDQINIYKHINTAITLKKQKQQVKRIQKKHAKHMTKRKQLETWSKKDKQVTPGKRVDLPRIEFSQEDEMIEIVNPRGLVEDEIPPVHPTNLGHSFEFFEHQKNIFKDRRAIGGKIKDTTAKLRDLRSKVCEMEKEFASFDDLRTTYETLNVKYDEAMEELVYLKQENSFLESKLNLWKKHLIEKDNNLVQQLKREENFQKKLRIKLYQTKLLHAQQFKSFETWLDLHSTEPFIDTSELMIAYSRMKKYLQNQYDEPITDLDEVQKKYQDLYQCHKKVLFESYENMTTEVKSIRNAIFREKTDDLSCISSEENKQYFYWSRNQFQTLENEMKEYSSIQFKAMEEKDTSKSKDGIRSIYSKQLTTLNRIISKMDFSFKQNAFQYNQQTEHVYESIYHLHKKLHTILKREKYLQVKESDDKLIDEIKVVNSSFKSLKVDFEKSKQKLVDTLKGEMIELNESIGQSVMEQCKSIQSKARETIAKLNNENHFLTRKFHQARTEALDYREQFDFLEKKFKKQEESYQQKLSKLNETIQKLQTKNQNLLEIRGIAVD